MLWNKENKFWSKYEQTWTTEEFLKTLDKVYTYAKCTSAAAYTTTHKLDDLFDLIHYQHGFYFWITGADSIFINDISLEAGKLYNLSILYNRDQILSDIQDPVQKVDYINYNIRYAIANGMAIAANSNLFRLDGAYDEFQQILFSGTSGTSGLPLYSQYILNADFTKDDVYGVFNPNFEQLGYSVPNYFTADITINKLLSNFNLVDYVSDTNLDITQLYQSLTVDGVQLFEDQIVFLINQDNPVENGPYTYANQTLTKVDWVETAADLNLLTIFVKEGLVYKSFEYFLSRNPDGTFPGLNDPKYFETGKNLLIRNKISYKLLQDNENRAGFYYTEEDPIIDANFTDIITVDGDSYQISSNGKYLLNLTLLSNTSGTASTSSTSGTSGTSGDSIQQIVPLFNAKSRLVEKNGKIYFLNYVYPNTELWSYDPILNYYNLENIFAGEVIDFCFSTNYLILLFAQYSTSSNNTVQIYDSTYTLKQEFLTDILSNEVKAFEGINNLSIFLSTAIGVYQYFTDLLFTTVNYELILDGDPIHLALDADGSSSTSGNLYLSWIDSDNSPRRYSNEAYRVGAGLSFYKDVDYLIYPQSKQLQGNWQIINDTLYLKGSQVSGTNGITLPKIDTTVERFFDGKVDYVSFDTSINTNSVTSPFVGLSSFTIDFTINPSTLKASANVFYFGEARPSQRPLIGSSSLFNLTQTPINYIMFSVNEGGFPTFIVSNTVKSLSLVSSSVLTVGVNNNISITWDYTSSRVSARFYLNGQLVGSLIDQVLIQNKVVITPVLDISTIPFNVNVLGRSEFLAHPLYNGYLSEIRIWNKVLNQAQINARAGAPIATTDNLRPNLTSYWTLKDTDYEILDQIANRDGIFVGGLGSDPILPEIQTPTQIVETSTYLYILTQDNYDNIYRVNLMEEYVQQMLPDAGTNGRNIQSIQVDQDILYYLTNNTIYKYDHTDAVFLNNIITTDSFTPTISISGTINIFDFAVDETHIYYVIGNDILRDNESILNQTTLTNGISWGTNGVAAMYISNQDINGDSISDFINVYIEDNSNELHILSSPYNAAGIQIPSAAYTGLSYKGFYPMFEHSNSDIKTWTVGSNTISLRLVNSIKELYINNIELDSAGEYFNFNSSIQDITIVGTRIIVISKVNNGTTAELWSYDLNTGLYQLFKCGNSSVEHLLTTNATTIAVDYFSYNSKDYLILGDASRVTMLSFGIRTFSDKVTFSNITKYPITEIKSVDPFKCDVVSTDTTGLKYFNILNLNDISLWQDVLTYNETTKGWWVADFGVAYSHFSDNYGTSGDLTLLNTVVREDFINTTFDVSKTFNDNNYIVPNLSGTGWIIGKSGLIIKTEDYGVTWEVLVTTTPDDLNDVSFFDINQGMIVGKNGIILYTFNGGTLWEVLNLPQVNNKTLFKVLMYQKTRVIITGQGGLILHLTLINNIWTIDNILIPASLASVTGETDTRIHVLYQDTIENTTITTDIIDVKLFEDNFYFASNNFLIQLNITYQNNLISFSNINYVLPDSLDNIDIIRDPVTQETSLIALTATGNIITASLERISPTINTNIYPIVNTATRTAITTYPNLASNGSFYNNNRLYRFDKEIYSTELFTGSGDTWVRNDLNFQEIDPTTELHFKPRLLFLDYYLGRKINIQLSEGEFIIPTGTFDKTLLDCYKMLPGDFIEFSEYGTVKNQRNYLAIQDYYLLNRRIQDGGLNTYGVVETPRKYNKRLTAVSDTSNYSIETFIIPGPPTSGSYASTSSAAEFVSEPAGLVEDIFYENTKVNKIRLYNTPFTAASGDVLRITAITNYWGIDPALKVSLGNVINALDQLVVRYSVIKQNILDGQYVYNIVNQEEIVTISSDGFFSLPGVGLLGQESVGTYGNYIGLTAEQLAQRIITDTLAIISVQSNLVDYSTSVEVFSVEWLIFDETVILRDQYINDLILWEQFSPDMIADIKYPTSVISGQQLGAKIRIKNTNYFSAEGQNLFTLKDTFDNHLLSEAYNLTIDQPGVITISGNVNNTTKYYNLETTVTWTVGVSNYSIPIKYESGNVYGPTYEIMNILENLDPIFTYDYEIDMPSQVFNIDGFPTNEFTLTDNIFYATKNFSDPTDLTSNYYLLDSFLPGTFVDITKGNTTIKRCYIIKKTYETNFLGNARVLLYVDRNLNILINETTTQVSIRSRNKLIEISKDLEFTDDISFPTPATDGLFGTNGVIESPFNKAVYNFTKTSGVYANYLLNDDNIKKNISAIVRIDEAGDVVMNVIDWLDDPNFAYRPVDAFEMGRDFQPKKGITVRPYNYHLQSDWFQLTGLDFTNYTFTLTDGLTLQSLTTKYPWILNAEVDNAIIGEDSTGLIWYQGSWFDGIWSGSKWYSGTWYSGTWTQGDWYSYQVQDLLNIYVATDTNDNTLSTWLGGTFQSDTVHSVWHNGQWFGGSFENSIWTSGQWFGGSFENSIWTSGNFMGGSFINSTFQNGVFSSSNLPSTWFSGIWIGGDFGNGTWLNGLWSQTSSVPSRFGTATSPILKATWEAGLFSGGFVFDGINQDSNGNYLPSTRYKYTTFKNVLFTGGDWYGGTLSGASTWTNATWHFGLFESSLNIKAIYRLDDDHIRLDFTQPHGFKDFLDPTIQNTITIIGEPNTSFGFITNSAKFFGYNSEPASHIILDSSNPDYIIIANENNYGDRLLSETSLLLNPNYNLHNYFDTHLTNFNLSDHSVQFWFSVEDIQTKNLINHPELNLSLDGNEITYTVSGSELSLNINLGEYNYITAQTYNGVQELWKNNVLVSTSSGVYTNGTSGTISNIDIDNVEGALYELKVWNGGLNGREIEDSMSNYQLYSTSGITTYYNEGTAGTNGGSYLLAYYPLLAGTSGLVSTYDVISNSFRGYVNIYDLSNSTSGTSGTSGNDCYDYTLPVALISILPNTTGTDSDYINGPNVVSVFRNGQFFNGIMKDSLVLNAVFTGGIAINTIWDSGQFGDT
jgi:hypothetical protein